MGCARWPAVSRSEDNSDIRRLLPDQAEYPAELRAIPDPPCELYVRGAVPPAPRVAVVGSRRADEYGLALARRMGEGLAAAGVCVVSGGAGGVDTAALQGCLEAGGRAVAVLGTGVDVTYPARNRKLFERVAQRGALLSEYPPGTEGRPEHFPRRNRLVSGLSLGVVVVQAARESGSLITAREAARQGRLVMAVPGPAGHELSAGVHDLLRRGARLVESAPEALNELGLARPGESAQERLPLTEPPPDLSPEERGLLEAIGEVEHSIDALTQHSGLPSGKVAALLFRLELLGLVSQKPGQRYARTGRSTG